jgi:hypothetical protein
MLPLRDWSVGDRGLLSLVGEDRPDRKRLPPLQAVRLIVEPAVAARAAETASHPVAAA